MTHLLVCGAKSQSGPLLPQAQENESERVKRKLFKRTIINLSFRLPSLEQKMSLQENVYPNN